MNSAVPQRHRLTEMGDPEPCGTTSQGGQGAGHEPVPVAIGLDDSHHRGRPGVFAKNLDIAPDGVQIHGRPGRRPPTGMDSPLSTGMTAGGPW